MPNTPPAAPGVASRLAAFLRAGPAKAPDYAKRPAGPLVWLHFPTETPPEPVQELCQMLCARHKGLACLLSSNEETVWRDAKNTFVTRLPNDTALSVEDFLNHWQPDLLLWADPIFQLRVLQRFKSHKKPMFLINMPVLDLSRRSIRRTVNTVLAQFDRAQVVSSGAAERLQSLGYPAEKIVKAVPISEMAWPLPDDETMRRAIATGLGPRPIWCAPHLRISELSVISNAHHIARKSFPTAALIIVPAAGEDVGEISRILRSGGWRVSTDNPASPVDPQCDILLASSPKVLGVWYRLASVCVMGGSFNGPASCDPFEAVALGSAVICGAITFPHGARFRQLAKGSALVRVDNPANLGASLASILAPDKSAELATAGWRVGSEGVEALTQIANLVDTVIPQGQT